MKKASFRAYALFGSGRLAKHLHFYLESLNLPVLLWSRDGDPRFNSFDDLSPADRLQRVLRATSHVLLAVKDEAIRELSELVSPVHTVVHFSGSVRLPTAASCHPLMTFGKETEALDWYPRIPFVIDEDQSFSELLPGLSNPHYRLAPDQRTFYHALCSLAGNSTFLLWKQIGDEFERRLKLPRALLGPFLHQVVANSSRFAETGFTGPVARGDWSVVAAHLESLGRSPDLLEAYRRYLKSADHNGHKIPEALL